jgi:hypothetical protein
MDGILTLKHHLTSQGFLFAEPDVKVAKDMIDDALR